MEVDQSVAEISWFFDVSNMAAVRHVGFSNFENVVGRLGSPKSQLSSSCQISSPVLRRQPWFFFAVALSAGLAGAALRVIVDNACYMDGTHPLSTASSAAAAADAVAKDL